MPFFGLFWVTSWINCLFASSQGLFKVPEYIYSAIPAKVFSVIGSSPIEKPSHLVVPTQVNSRIWPYNRSIATLPSLTFQLAGESSQIASNNATTGSIYSGKSTIEKALCPTALAKKEDKKIASPVIIPKAVSQAAMGLEVNTAKESKTSITSKILQVMQNLWRGQNSVEQSIKAPPPVVVIRASDQKRVGDTELNNNQRAKLGFWLYSQLRPGRVGVVTPSEKNDSFQIWVKGNLIAEIPNQVRAELIAENLTKLVSDPSLNASELQLAIADGIPAGKIGDRVLFVIDDAIANDLKRNREILATEWLNNLRIALGEPPLSLATAQMQMHSLVETDKKIEGLASFYGGYFHGRLTANGETYNQFALTAAHKELPFNTYLKVTNLKNGQSTIVRINDRGPYIPPRSLDLSVAAARCIESEEAGVIPYSAVIMQPTSPPSSTEDTKWSGL